MHFETIFMYLLLLVVQFILIYNSFIFQLIQLEGREKLCTAINLNLIVTFFR